MPTTLAQYNPTIGIQAIEQVTIPQDVQISTEASDCVQLSLWGMYHDAGSFKPQSIPLKVEDFMTVYVGMLNGQAVVLAAQKRDPTQAVRPDEIRQLTSVAKRNPVPLALRPDAFRADDVLDKLRELREIHGSEYGRAKRLGRRIPLSE